MARLWSLWESLTKWWRRRRLVPNGGRPEGAEPNEETGRELQRFFIGLLENGQDLRDYTSPGLRQDVVGRKELSEYARWLLEEGSLREIEENIVQIPGSHARPWLIVWPF
jgi:hypothetical protein